MLLILFNRFLLLCERTVPSVSLLTIFLHLELFKQILLLAFPNTGGTQIVRGNLSKSYLVHWL